MSDMMYPDPMFYPGYYPNSGVNYMNQFYNPAYLKNSRDNLLNQFDDEFDSVMGDYNRKMAKLQLMKMDLKKQNEDSYTSKPYRHRNFDVTKELMEVVDTPIRRKEPLNNVFQSPSASLFKPRNQDRGNYISRVMFDSEKTPHRRHVYDENKGPDPYTYKTNSRSNLNNTMGNPDPYKISNRSNGGVFNINDFSMGRR